MRNPDGSIDPAESYLVIQDQRAGTGQLFYEVEEDGEMHYYSGRTNYKYYFDRLLADYYIPVTTAEFMGTDAYEPPTVTYTNTNGTYDTLDAMMTGNLECNFPICIVKVIATDEDGQEIMLDRKLLDKTHVRNGKARNLFLSDMRYDMVDDNYDALETGKTYTVRLDVTVSNGEIFTPVQMQVVG